MNFTKWYNNLPRNTKDYLDSRPIWHDKDILIAIFIGFIFGVMITWIS
jgi:hypothetical protein